MPLKHPSHYSLWISRWLLVMLLSASCFIFAEQEQPNHAVALLYHHVDDDTPAVTSVTPAQFAEQLRYLHEHNFHVWPLRKIVVYLQHKRSIPANTVAITFDDGYRSIYDNAFPLLKQYGWPFTLFLSTEPIDKAFGSHLRWHQLREMANNGADIENHTVTHLHMPFRPDGESSKEWLQKLDDEIGDASSRIIHEIGRQPVLFAYPYGEYSKPTKALVKKHGLTGIGQQSGAIGEDSDWLAVPRFPIAGNYAGIDDFATKLHTLPLNPIILNTPDNPLAYSNDQPVLELQLPVHLPHVQLNCFGTGQGALMVLKRKDTFIVQPNKSIPVGRSRYNCTAAAGTVADGTTSYYWFSHLWIRLKADGGWTLD